MMIQVLGIPMDGWAALALAIQFVLPLLVGLVTTKETNRQVQFFLLGGLTVLTTVATQVLQDHDAHAAINLVQIVVAAVVNFGIAILSHYAVWKPTNLSDLVLAIFSRAAAPVAAPSAPTPQNPAPAAPEAPLAARHLALAPVAPVTVPAAADLPLEPLPAVVPLTSVNPVVPVAPATLTPAPPQTNRMAG